jgi:hypothetical protein
MIGMLGSLYDFGGVTAFSQYLELGIATGYFVGTYLLAKQESDGYAWYVLMHVSCGWLMWAQGYTWLCAQQGISLVFIVDAFLVSSRRQR